MRWTRLFAHQCRLILSGRKLCRTTSRWWIAGILNANDAAATAKHTDLTAAKILFAQTAKGQDVLTDNDKALVERLRDESIVGMPMENEAADRIEALRAEIERLREALRDILRGDDPAIPGAIEHIARAALGETE